MKITIRAHHLMLSPEEIQQIRQRIYQAFGRVSPWVRTVDVTLTDINGPRGGADKQCRVRVRGRGLSSVVIEHLGSDTLSTVSHAAERAEQTMLRKVARRRSFVPGFAY